MIRHRQLWIFGFALVWVYAVFLQSTDADLEPVEASRHINVERRQYPDGMDKRINGFLDEDVDSEDLITPRRSTGYLLKKRPRKLRRFREARTECPNYCTGVKTENGRTVCECKSGRRLAIFGAGSKGIGKNAKPSYRECIVSGDPSKYLCVPISDKECICYERE
ncbi:uncharacterized protein LOC141914926 isoform X2 [Tubulanus polymorphus]|uniref:uncharacterized protein LOC141914926 isoform X2 n=1 Tax=Tubulanus polymorphus TaxID=672921 RepID=UPI003DA560D8